MANSAVRSPRRPEVVFTALQVSQTQLILVVQTAGRGGSIVIAGYHGLSGCYHGL